jgi:hypothetical protein
VKFSATLREHLQHDAEKQAAPVYIPKKQLDPPSPSTLAILALADSAAESMEQDVAEGHQVLDTTKDANPPFENEGALVLYEPLQQPTSSLARMVQQEGEKEQHA